MLSVVDIDTRDISSELLLPNGKLKLLSASDYKKFTSDEIIFFCWKNARYGLSTIEVVDYIKGIINNRTAIEIGAGYGDLGYHLGIPMTDSKIQENPKIKANYEAFNQPTIQYPKDVEKIEALDAVRKYKPQVVVASWVTTYSPIPTPYGSSPHGVKEGEILKLVETFILVGNLDQHSDKPIFKRKHIQIDNSTVPIISRAKNSHNNRIFVINGDLGNKIE